MRIVAMNYLLLIVSLFASSAVMAADRVALDSKVFVERQIVTAEGKAKTIREDPKLVVPGEKLLFVLKYKNEGAAPAADFVVTNPIPPAVAFVASETVGAQYSVDGGKHWGALSALTVTGPDGKSRSAVASDITHIRWTLAKAIPVGGEGVLSFRGLVR
jgi:uncharacterized repeat protein (TIGR01451 family)